MQNAISLPAGLQVTPNMFFLRNDQGQVMLMTGQPQAVPGAGGEVRLQQPSGTAVFRVCDAFLIFLDCKDLQVYSAVFPPEIFPKKCLASWYCDCSAKKYGLCRMDFILYHNSGERPEKYYQVPTSNIESVRFVIIIIF